MAMHPCHQLLVRHPPYGATELSVCPNTCMHASFELIQMVQKTCG